MNLFRIFIPSTYSIIEESKYPGFFARLFKPVRYMDLESFFYYYGFLPPLNLDPQSQIIFCDFWIGHTEYKFYSKDIRAVLLDIALKFENSNDKLKFSGV